LGIVNPTAPTATPGIGAPTNVALGVPASFVDSSSGHSTVTDNVGTPKDANTSRVGSAIASSSFAHPRISTKSHATQTMIEPAKT
jgi:hypothetical protein